MVSNPFRDRSVIIAGASSGIGRAVSLLLADQGANMVVAARRADRLEALAQECQLRGGRAIPIPTNVAVETQCQKLVERTLKEFGRLDMLVFSAGIGVGGRLSDLPDLELFRRVVDVNFYGAVHTIFHALPHLKESRGRLVLVTSLGGKLAIPYNTSYCASKYGLHGFADSLRMELVDEGVSVTVVCPYWVITEFHEHFMDKEGQPLGQEGRRVYTQNMMTADRCAEIILDAANRRKREVLLGPGRLGVWLKLIAPNLTDRFIIKPFMHDAIRRTRRRS